jgi:uncharacterized repeat protein (TIGR02543 family)
MFSSAARPALNLDLTNTLFTSEATGNGKSAAQLGDGLVAATLTPGAKLKFTMIDGDSSFLNLIVPDLTPRFAMPGGTVSVDYEDAIVGTDKYVSCVITDDFDNVLLYGKLAAATDGTLNIQLPSDMAIGSYKVKLFNEQVNGDNYTDFSSVPIEIPLTVALTPPGPTEYELTFVTNGGSAVASELIAAGTVHPLTEATTREGYTFVCWCADAELNMPESDVTMDTDRTVYAAWNANPITPPYTPDPTPTPTPPPEETPDPSPTPDPTPTPEPTPTPTPEQPPVPNIPGNTVVPGDDGSYIELDEDGTPKGEWHWDDSAEEWIYDEYPPLGDLPIIDPAPKTGDSGTAVWVILCAASMSAFIWLVVFKDKRKNF